MNAQLELDTSRMSFTAIDFETADSPRNSACAVGLVRVEGGQIVGRRELLIRPPFQYVRFTEIHGITWSMVRDQPTFRELWPQMRELIEGVDFLAAHNASFDKGVLHASCQAVGIAPPQTRFICTVKLARATWHLQRARLPLVCEHLGITLNHHNALSDAEACARIVLAAGADRVDAARR